MLHSMTGYGKATASLKDKSLSIEIKSLNSKYLDLSVRLPHIYKSKEIILRQWLAPRLYRGKVELSINIEAAQTQGFSINPHLFKAYHKELSSLTNSLSISDEHMLPVIMRIPDVMIADKEDISEKEWKTVLNYVENAIQEFTTFRRSEGDALCNDLYSNVERIKNGLTAIEQLAPERIQHIRLRLQQSIDEMRDKYAVNTGKATANRFEQELIYYLEKLDINEEIVRLKSHCQHFEAALSKKEVFKGKRLHFIAQEIGREINTIGAKANFATIQTHVINMKEALDKIKEQSLNVV